MKNADMQAHAVLYSRTVDKTILELFGSDPQAHDTHSVAEILGLRDLLMGELAAVMCYNNVIYGLDTTLEQVSSLLPGMEKLENVPMAIGKLLTDVLSRAKQNDLLETLLQDTRLPGVQDPAANIHFSFMFSLYSAIIAELFPTLPANFVSEVAKPDKRVVDAFNLGLAPIGMRLNDKNSSEGATYTVNPSALISIGDNLSEHSFYLAPEVKGGGERKSYTPSQSSQTALRFLSETAAETEESQFILFPITLPLMFDFVNAGEAEADGTLIGNKDYNDGLLVGGRLRTTLTRGADVFRETAIDELHDGQGSFMEWVSNKSEEAGPFVLTDEWAPYIKQTLVDILEMIELYNR